MALPPATLQERLGRLARANHYRCVRAAVKQHLRQLGRQLAAEAVARIIMDPASELHGMPVTELLAAIPTIGPSRLRTARHQAAVTDTTRLRDLTPRQRITLNAWVTGLQVDRYECPGCGGQKWYDAKRCLACARSRAA